MHSLIFPLVSAKGTKLSEKDNRSIFNNKLARIKKEELKLYSYFGYFLNKNYECPCCGKIKMNLFYASKKEKYCLNCYSCSSKYDLLDIVEMNYNVKEYGKKVNILVEILENETLEFKEEITEEKEIKHLNNGTFLEYFKECNNRLKENYSYFLKRGFENKDFDILKSYWLGTDENGNIIFPMSKYSYIKRSIKGKGKFRYQNSKSFNDECHYIWNLKKINNHKIIYIFEGIFDALTMQVLNSEIDTDILAISVGGINVNRLKKYLEKYKEQEFIFLLAFDNDEKGVKATTNFFEQLNKIEFPNIKVLNVSPILLGKQQVDQDFENGYKDLNERLQKEEREKIKARILYINNFTKYLLKNENKEIKELFLSYKEENKKLAEKTI